MCRKFLTFLVLAGLISCQQDDLVTVNHPAADIEVLDGMLVFASETAYSNTLTAIERMSPVEQKAWVAQFRFTPLTNILNGAKNPDEIIETQGLSHLTPAHWFVLNDERRVQVGRVVMYFNDKTKYFMKIDEYNKLTDKRDIAKSPWTGIILSEVLNTKEDPSGRIYFDAWNKGDIGVGGTQHTFNSPATGIRKFVIEWVSSVEQMSSPPNPCGDVVIRARLYLRCKNLRLSGASWVPAFDPFSVDVNIDVDGVRLYYGFHQPGTCSYTDAMWGPPSVPYNGYFAHISVSTIGYVYSGSFYVLIASAPDFYGEWHATFDLKKWEGYSTGTVTMYNTAAPYGFTYIM